MVNVLERMAVMEETTKLAQYLREEKERYVPIRSFKNPNYK